MPPGFRASTPHASPQRTRVTFTRRLLPPAAPVTICAGLPELPGPARVPGLPRVLPYKGRISTQEHDGDRIADGLPPSRDTGNHRVLHYARRARRIKSFRYATNWWRPEQRVGSAPPTLLHQRGLHQAGVWPMSWGGSPTTLPLTARWAGQRTIKARAGSLLACRTIGTELRQAWLLRFSGRWHTV